MEATLAIVVTDTLAIVVAVILDATDMGQPLSVSVSVPVRAWADHVHHTSLPRARKSQARLSITKCQTWERPNVSVY